jgi:nitric oxide reductase activation protein
VTRRCRLFRARSARYTCYRTVGELRGWRFRWQEASDEIDINAAIAGLTDIRLGNQPDPRIMMRSVRKTRDFSILVLLDLSESTNEKVHGQDYSVLDLTRQACVLLSDAIAKVGDPFAIQFTASALMAATMSSTSASRISTSPGTSSPRPGFPA